MVAYQVYHLCTKHHKWLDRTMSRYIYYGIIAKIVPSLRKKPKMKRQEVEEHKTIESEDLLLATPGSDLSNRIIDKEY